MRNDIVMPVLRPIRICTKGLPFWKKVWTVLTAVRQWELAENWFYTIPTGETIVIPKGFIFDGASTPKFMWGFLEPTGVLLIQGLVHDFGYRYDYLWSINVNGRFHKIKEGSGKSYFDSLFVEVGRDVNELNITAYLSWLMLIFFGSKAWNENRRRNASDIHPNFKCY